MISVEDLTVAYGDVTPLDGLTTELGPDPTAVMGPSGSGKSTLLRVIAGLQPPSSGLVEIDGTPPRQASWRSGGDPRVALIHQDYRLVPFLTVEENLLLMSYAGVPAEAVLETAFAYFPRLKERRKQLAGTMSGGEQQMVAMSRALASDPALLLLDELSMGLAPLIVDELYETVGRITETGVSILCIEQFARTALKISDYAAVMTGGRVVATGEPAEILETMSDVILGGAA